jgi:hypothetical protein
MLELLRVRSTGWNDFAAVFVAEAKSRHPECFNSTKRGYTMPAFTFEKISPPPRRGPIPPIEQKQRGVIVQVLGRFVEARVQRAERIEQASLVRRDKAPDKSPPE